MRKEQSMKTTVICAVKAYLAAEEMSRQELPYDLALALVKVKQATRAEMETFAAEERKLIEKYARLDEAGRIQMRGNGFVFANPQDAPKYEEARRTLGAVETEIQLPRLTAAPPKTIQPGILEALSAFIEFGGEDV